MLYFPSLDRNPMRRQKMLRQVAQDALRMCEDWWEVVTADTDWIGFYSLLNFLKSLRNKKYFSQIVLLPHTSDLSCNFLLSPNFLSFLKVSVLFHLYSLPLFLSFTKAVFVSSALNQRIKVALMNYEWHRYKSPHASWNSELLFKDFIIIILIILLCISAVEQIRTTMMMTKQVFTPLFSTLPALHLNRQE